MSGKNKEKGDIGEDLAVEMLQEKGYEIITRKYTFGKGEIDIVAVDPHTKDTVFIEVKYKESIEYGYPEHSITKSKQKQVRKVAELYLYEKELHELNCRFDVITVLSLPFEKPVIEHYENAF